MRQTDSRRMVALEAARLIYFGDHEEYRQAKEAASRRLNINVLPSNFEVAIELDKIAEETEGDGRRELLLKMRGEALCLMSVLSEFDPRLIGSVWRGTARKGSDIDIVVYSSDLNIVQSKLSFSGFEIKGIIDGVAQEFGRLRSSKHIKVGLKGDVEAEIVVRPLEEKELIERCDLYGDIKKGLNIIDLEKLMKTDPLRKFVPVRRLR